MSYIRVLVSSILDFLYMPLVRAHIREMALRVPLFPGQLWYLPMLGTVRIKSATDYTVTYIVLDEDGDENYVTKRSEFFKFARPHESDSQAHVIPFTVFNKEDE